MRLPELLERAVPDGTASGRGFGGIFLLLPVRCRRGGIDASLGLPVPEIFYVVSKDCQAYPLTAGWSTQSDTWVGLTSIWLALPSARSCLVDGEHLRSKSTLTQLSDKNDHPVDQNIQRC